MIYRIDMKHFLTHAIDHFTLEELTHFEYAIISSPISNGGRTKNVAKVNELYPTADILIEYDEYKDAEMFERMYMDLLKPKGFKEERKYMIRTVYHTFINPLLNHVDVMIICDESENLYIDVLCKYLKNEFDIEVIDLNQLFTKGRVGPIYIDRDKIWDNAVDIRRAAGRDEIEAMESTPGGRLRLLEMMNRKDKIRKLDSLGISVTNADKHNLDKLLIDAWVEDGDG